MQLPLQLPMQLQPRPGPPPGNADADGNLDIWENAKYLNLQDARDAVRDFDYDRVSNLDDYTASPEPHTDWTFIEALNLSDREDGVASSNDVSEFIALAAIRSSHGRETTEAIA